jgi:hypothetical protein
MSKVTIKYPETYVLALAYNEQLLAEWKGLQREFNSLPWWSYIKAKKNLARQEKLNQKVLTINGFRDWCEESFEAEIATLELPTKR